jgi:hypothetical protein
MDERLDRNSLRHQFVEPPKKRSTLGYLHIGKTARGGMAVVRNWQEVEEILPQPGYNSLVVTHSTFPASRFIDVLLNRGTCDRLMITTYNIAPEAVEKICRGIDSGAIVTATVLVNGALRRLKSGETVVDRLEEMAARFPGRVSVYERNVHAKLICMAMANRQDFWVVEGSGNMADNAFVELYSVFNSAERFQFHAEWIGALLQR